MTLHGYVNPQQEDELAQAIASRLPAIPVLSAARLWPEIREYERTLVAVLNAYIQPLMQHYFSRLEHLLAQHSIGAPLLITASNGGVLPLDAARQRPVDTLLSGPASGATAAAQLLARAGGGGYISFDMGGTSSDISLSAQGEVERVNRTDIGGFPLILPVVGVSAIGAGGGSIIRVDDYGILKVGPESAGADPGPVAYGRGGRQPTLTDCYLISGILQASAFLDGTMPLDLTRAQQALAKLAGELGLKGEDAAAQLAASALAVASTQMATELNKVLAQRGVAISGLTLIPFGGAGPTHANLLAEEAGIEYILVPLHPGTFCAQGAVAADIRRDFVHSLRTDINGASLSVINAALHGLRAQANQWFEQQASDFSQQVQWSVEADMRYVGQAWELTAVLGNPADLTLAQMCQAFEQLHQQRYGFINPDAVIGLTTLRLSLTVLLPPLPHSLLNEDHAEPVPLGSSSLFWQGRWQVATVWERNALRRGVALSGPAIVQQADTTTLILPGWEGRPDEQGNLLISRQLQGERR
jgi:N-methylhydantoinase A